MKRRIQTEYAYVAAFAERRGALLKRLRRTGEQEPGQWDRPFTSEAYLHDLELLVRGAERRRRSRDRQSRRPGPSTWPWLTAMSWFRLKLKPPM